MTTNQTNICPAVSPDKRLQCEALLGHSTNHRANYFEGGQKFVEYWKAPTTNPNHYSNCAREPHVGDIVYHNAASQEFKVLHSAFVAPNYKMVTPWWAVDAKAGDQVKDRGGDVWTLHANDLWSRGYGDLKALWLEQSRGPCEPVKAEPETPTLPAEPSALTDVVVGKIAGGTAMAVHMDSDDEPWNVQTGDGYYQWLSWTDLCRELTDIRVVDVAELADTPKTGVDCCLWSKAFTGKYSMELGGFKIAPYNEPGPWLRGDELLAVLPTLKADMVVEVEYRGRTVTGKLHADGSTALILWDMYVRYGDGCKAGRVDALRIIERAPEPEPEPEPGADIPDEVVEAALAAIPWASEHRSRAGVRAALAAADAKRAELDGGVA